MSISHLLESFEGADQDDGGSISMSELSLEEEKLEAFERGYKAGWDDAAKAQAEDRNHLTSDFANNLQELSFTYHEASGHLARALRPVMTQIVEAVLPEIARKSFGPRIAEQLTGLALAVGKQRVEIVVAPQNIALVRGLLDEDPGFPVQLVEEPSLGAGQAYLRFGDGERQIDHDEVLSRIAKALDAFFDELKHTSEKELKHGG
ncbi:FliH/SctL family protein [Marimonas arenosa]|uniref:Flagellar assembly protein FliH n=1 Tax=Marimonas arenosa TaxID=1795305 RepID=A0AAE4B5Q5_9RHOB|nr:hypothetical protein [Marimonas arenosa]MDQ2090574.1 hypothetical protein [Marimonas arenosa]